MSAQAMYRLDDNGQCIHAGRTYHQFEGDFIASRCERSGWDRFAFYEYTIRKTDCGTYFLVTVACTREEGLKYYLELFTNGEVQALLASWRKKNKLPRI